MEYPYHDVCVGRILSTIYYIQSHTLCQGHTLHIFTYTLCQGHSLLYIYSHIHYAKDTPYSTYIHMYIMPRILPTIYYIHSHTLCQGYLLLTLHTFTHIRTHIHTSFKGIPYNTLPHIYITPRIQHTLHTLTHTHTYTHMHTHTHHSKDTPYYVYTHSHIHNGKDTPNYKPHTFTHVLHKVYFIIYVHSHIQHDKYTLVHTYTHTYNILMLGIILTINKLTYVLC